MKDSLIDISKFISGLFSFFNGMKASDEIAMVALCFTIIGLLINNAWARTNNFDSLFFKLVELLEKDIKELYAKNKVVKNKVDEINNILKNELKYERNISAIDKIKNNTRFEPLVLSLENEFIRILEILPNMVNKASNSNIQLKKVNDTKDIKDIVNERIKAYKTEEELEKMEGMTPAEHIIHKLYLIDEEMIRTNDNYTGHIISEAEAKQREFKSMVQNSISESDDNILSSVESSLSISDDALNKIIDLSTDLINKEINERFVDCDKGKKLVGNYFEEHEEDNLRKIFILLNRIAKIINRQFRIRPYKRKKYVGILRTCIPEGLLVLIYYDALFNQHGKKLNKNIKRLRLFGSRKEIDERIHLSSGLLYSETERERMIAEYATRFNFLKKLKFFNLK